MRQRPYSIRTRIKTPDLYESWLNTLRQRPYSIRTRIKTPNRIHQKNSCQSETIFH